MSGNLKTLELGIKARTHSSDVGLVYISPRPEQVGQMLGYMKYYALVDLLTASDMGVSELTMIPGLIWKRSRINLYLNTYQLIYKHYHQYGKHHNKITNSNMADTTTK